MNFPKKFPILKAGIYLLRESKKSDAKFFFEYLSDPKTIRHTSYDIKTIDEIKKWFDDYKKQFKEAKRISWTIEDAKTKKAIGEISLFDIQTEHKKAEIGYFLGRDYWGQGIMSKVLEKIIKYSSKELKINRLQSVFMKGNTASRKLLEKNSFKKEGVLKKYKICRGRYCDFVLYSMVNGAEF